MLLVSGSAEAPGAARARRACKSSATSCTWAGAPTALPVHANVAVLDDGLVSGQARAHHARRGRLRHRRPGQQERHLRRQRAQRGPGQRLRDGALVFVGNHVAVFRLVSAIELEAMKAELVAPLGPVATASPVAGGRLRSAAAAGGVGGRAVHRRRDRRRQGGLRARRARGERPQGQVRRHQLRRDPARAGRERAVRLSRRGALDRAPGQGRPDRGGRGRHAVPRRDRRDDPGGADQDPALPAGPRADAAGLDAAATHGRAHPRRDQPRDRGRRASRRGLRDDIVARLGAAPIHLPPLRNRIEDIGALAAHFLAPRAAASARFEQPAFRAMSPARLAAERARAGEDRHHRRGADRRRQADRAARSAGPDRARHRRAGRDRACAAPTGPSPTPAQLEELLRRYEGNVADVSRELGKHRAAVWRWIKKFGLGPQKFRRSE